MCKIQGCSNPAVANGLCAMHYMRLKRHGDATATHKPGPKPKPEPPSALDVAALKARIREFEAELAEASDEIKAVAFELQPQTLALRDEIKSLKALIAAKPTAVEIDKELAQAKARIAELEAELVTAKMQLSMAQHDLAQQARASAPNMLVLALQTQIKSLEGQVAHWKAQAAPKIESEEIKKRDKTIRKLQARLYLAANAPTGTLVMAKKDRQLIRRVLHPDFNPSAANKKQLLNDASQIFNALPIREADADE